MENEQKCALCERPADVKPGLSSLLCKEHDDARLAAASFDRIWNDEGLTYSNAERFSQEKYIAMEREG